MTDLEIARLFHDTYERLAPSFGYETRADSKNGRLMIAVCGEVIRKARATAEPTAVVVEAAVDAYLDTYTTEFDEGSVTPDDDTKFVIKDAIMGLLADDDFSANLRAPAASVAPEPTAAIEAGRNTLRWLLNLTTEFDRKDVRTRQAARLLDDYGDGRGSTNRQLLEAMCAALSGVAPEQAGTKE